MISHKCTRITTRNTFSFLHVSLYQTSMVSETHLLKDIRAIYKTSNFYYFYVLWRDNICTLELILLLKKAHWKLRYKIAKEIHLSSSINRYRPHIKVNWP